MGHLPGLGRKSRRPARAPPRWNALEMPIGEGEVSQRGHTASMGASQSHSPHSPPPNSLSSQPKAQGLLQLRFHQQTLCTKSFCTGHSWARVPRPGEPRPSAVALGRERWSGPQGTGAGSAPRRKQARQAGGSAQDSRAHRLRGRDGAPHQGSSEHAWKTTPRNTRAATGNALPFSPSPRPKLSAP